jgi:hypothetical protein
MQDVYLACQGIPQLALAGFLVTVRGDINRVVAYRPLSDRITAGTSAWQVEVRRQLRIACRIAERPESARTAPDAIWLGYVGTGERAVPSWLYALACIPLTYAWDGELVSPGPFCPALFGRMAGQPQAARWFRDRPSSPPAAAGGTEGPPASPTFNP